MKCPLLMIPISKADYIGRARAEWQALRRAFPIGESEEIKS